MSQKKPWRDVFREKKVWMPLVLVVVLGMLAVVAYKVLPAGGFEDHTYFIMIERIEPIGDKSTIYYDDIYHVAVPTYMMDEQGLTVGDRCRISAWYEPTWFGKWDMHIIEVKKLR